jgi:hypothetical protein
MHQVRGHHAERKQAALLPDRVRLEFSIEIPSLQVRSVLPLFGQATAVEGVR